MYNGLVLKEGRSTDDMMIVECTVCSFRTHCINCEALALNVIISLLQHVTRRRDGRMECFDR